MSDLNNLLKQTFGFNAFRPGQEQTVGQLLQGHSSLAIFPTGSGKSLCYQVTALKLPHLTLVVSPLLALMKDQLDFLQQKNIPAASIDSTLTPQQNQEVMTRIRSGQIKILMVSVERFKNERFRQFIESVPVSMLVVDEAHCISEWGHNFRPDYLKLPAYRQQLNIPLALLLTATATRQVKRDMAQKFAIEPQHIVQTGFYRNNLDLTVLPVSGDKQQQLLQSLHNRSGAGIVYVTLQHSAEQVADFLNKNNIQAQAYHAGLKDEHRQQIQSDFMSGHIQVVVATIAFGMGIDKADIRYVIHYDLPKSIENYSQEIGRAGRDGAASDCITLASLDGIPVLENFVYGDTPEQDSIEAVLQNIRQDSHQGQWELQLLSLSNETNIRQLPLKTLLVQLELMGILQSMYTYFAEFKYKFLLEPQQILAQFSGERQSFLATIFELTLMKKIWGQPDFDRITHQSGSERSRIIAALEYLQEKQMIELSATKMTEVFRVDDTRLQESDLSGRLHHYFADKEKKEISRIATLIRFFQLDRCLSHNLARYFDDSQSPEQCGHCSVCRGQVAHLSRTEHPPWPSDDQLRNDLNNFITTMKSKTGQQMSQETCCRFLAGIRIPVFSRNKVSQLPGFASCEQQGYQQIRDKIASLNPV
ncbi:RecQ family ATP-dependent DNA helicase [Oceanospirillum sediminis]|uniref:ATP-dependent DNA helicase RecQ n=1 Tax=Oceanospirillum sediminis TaxID=2760088 RepID=A0A839IQU0_9GAMM|nr:RecQ family ATP-dependent DNA helicase [Oceanospirillum sediminis]MBB1486807.1 RecQ family ATP-dependent DNA helicase [Oceanospirillum sediminis]